MISNLKQFIEKLVQKKYLKFQLPKNSSRSFFQYIYLLANLLFLIK
jgi:hypothetical protein